LRRRFQNFENDLAPRRNLLRDVRRRCQITSLPTVPERHAGDPRGGCISLGEKKTARLTKESSALTLNASVQSFLNCGLICPGSMMLHYNIVIPLQFSQRTSGFQRLPVFKDFRFSKTVNIPSSRKAI
jgi:hypothetical protein